MEDIQSPLPSEPLPEKPYLESALSISPEIENSPNGNFSPADAMAVYNDIAAQLKLPIARRLTPGRTRALKARLAEHGEAGWTAACAALRTSPLCQGHNDRGWRADLDFVAQSKSCQRLIEGTYAGKPEFDIQAAIDRGRAKRKAEEDPPQ